MGHTYGIYFLQKKRRHVPDKLKHFTVLLGSLEGIEKCAVLFKLKSEDRKGLADMFGVW